MTSLRKIKYTALKIIAWETEEVFFQKLTFSQHNAGNWPSHWFNWSFYFIVLKIIQVVYKYIVDVKDSKHTETFRKKKRSPTLNCHLSHLPLPSPDTTMLKCLVSWQLLPVPNTGHPLWMWDIVLPFSRSLKYESIFSTPEIEKKVSLN